MNPEEEAYIQQLEGALQVEQSKSSASHAATALNSGEMQNLIEFQLDFKKELIDIERLLRKQTLQKDDEGNEKWVNPPADQELFNERGVQAVLELLRWYLNKNIILSNFDQETINLRLNQFGNALRRLIFLNYKEYGWDTKYKQKHYETTVLKLVDVVEAAYNRAFRGGERESLRTARTVNQNQPMGMPMNTPQFNNSQGSRRSWNPMSWGRQ